METAFLDAFSTIDILLSFTLSVIGAIGSFIVVLYYLGLDHQTQNYDEELRREIQSDPSFSGLGNTGNVRYVPTSDNKVSKVKTKIDTTRGKVSGKPYKIVLVDGDSIKQRKIEMIRERVREIPGKNLLSQDLVGAIRNYYAYNLALQTDGVSSGVVEHFKSNLEEYEPSNKVMALGDPSHFGEVLLIDNINEDSEKDVLNDVFIPLVRATEQFCVEPAPNANSKRKEIERCERLLRLAFFGLWTQRLKGIKVTDDHSRDDCVAAYRNDIRDRDNWGYWLLHENECDEQDFKLIRYLAWKIDGKIEEHWESGTYSKLHPKAESIIDLEHVENPFVLFQKNEEEFRGGASNGTN